MTTTKKPAKKAAPKKAEPRYRSTPAESVEGESETLFKGKPDPFKPGLLVQIESKKLRVIASDKSTVTFNVDGTPTVWKRQWLNDYDKGHIFIIPQ